jgi:hypothetical protein
MGRTRFTEKDLRHSVVSLNTYLKSEGIKVQFRLSPRNGYQAVDEYEVGDSWESLSSACRNVGCGTPREVNNYIWERYRQLQRKSS